ncbi:MAG TPA: FMN-binding protein [Candidatus Limnocylindrales bacterium]|nr:FMN-binding protein [Candidatus Limnocylindrales bacterium]
MIPKRALSAIVTTAFALILLLSFKTPSTGGLAASTTSDTAIVGQPTSPATTTGTTTDTSGTDAGTTTTDGTPAATAAPTATPAPTQDTTTATTSGYTDGTVTGDTISTRFGDVQVQVTISGGVITDVTALQLPSNDGHSARISQAAEPILRQEALTAQSASIDLLSGATYTSDAYAQSLQSALDQART